MRESYYAGLDVGLKSTFICVVDAQGEQLHSCGVASDIASISDVLNDLNVGAGID